MIKYFADKWHKYRDDLEKYFRETKQSEYDEYSKIVVALFDNVINRDNEFDSQNFNTKEMTVIDNGDWQGTQIFLLHKDTYQPTTEDYIYTNNYYGSCSGCDTLQAIIYSTNGNWDGLPTESQIKDYMVLALNLLQKIRFLSDEKELKLEVLYRTDDYGDQISQSISNKENDLHFGVFDLWECPEDAVIGRDLFTADDYISALNKGIELCKNGYDKVVANYKQTED